MMEKAPACKGHTIRSTAWGMCTQHDNNESVMSCTHSPTGLAGRRLLVVGGRGRGGGLAVLAKGGEGMGVPFLSATILWRSLMSLTTSFCCSWSFSRNIYRS